MYLLPSKQDSPRNLERFLVDTRVELSVNIVRGNNKLDVGGEFGAILNRNKIMQEHISLGTSDLKPVIEGAIATLGGTW